MVIAIIAILAAMLLPALGKAREMGKTIACAGNLKSIGSAAIQYGVDNTDYMPPAYYSGADNIMTNPLPNYRVAQMTWAAACSPYLGGQWTGANAKSAPAVFRCPSGQEELMSVADWPAMLTSNYKYSQRLGAPSSWSPRNFMRRLTRCKTPSGCAFLTDGKDKTTGSCTVPAVYYDYHATDWLSLRHSGASVDGVFADGHIERLNLRALLTANGSGSLPFGWGDDGKNNWP